MRTSGILLTLQPATVPAFRFSIRWRRSWVASWVMCGLGWSSCWIAYTELWRFLINDGYLKTQLEVFMQVEDTKKSWIKHQNKIKKYLPSIGKVRMLILTEKQFENCLLCQEKLDLKEKLVGAKDIVKL